LLEFEVNTDYYFEKPKIESVIIKFGSSVLPELLSGNVDASVNVNRIDLIKLGKDPQFCAYYYTTGFCGAIIWNQKHKKFSDPRVRRALTMAINRRELHQVLNLSDDLTIFDVIHTKRQYNRRELPEPVPYDPEQAKRLLDQAGWRDTDGDGIREREGKEFHFTMITSSYNETEAVYVQDQLRRVGVSMEIETLEWLLTIYRKRAGDFEAALNLVLRAFVENGFFSKDCPIGYHNPRIDEFITAYKEKVSPDEKDRIQRELWPIFQKDLPVTFLYPNIFGTHVAQRRIRGLVSPYRAHPILNMEYLWIEED